MYSTISADIVDSTSLSSEGIKILRKYVKDFVSYLETSLPGSWGRLTRGDFIECVIPKPQYSLRLALIFKVLVKSLGVKEILLPNSLLPVYGARIAIGMGDMRTIDRDNDIMDGEAIYLSGRQLDKKEPCSKGTLRLCSADDSLMVLDSICVLTDAIVNRMTGKQSEVVYYKLMNFKVEEISRKLNVAQSTISQHSTQACWYAIDNAVTTFEKFISRKYEQ